MYNFYRVVTKCSIQNTTKKYFSKSSYLFGNGENVKEALFVPFQEECSLPPRKVSIIGGGGKVGKTVLYNLVRHPICDEVAMVDLPAAKDKQDGEVLDFLHARSFMPLTPKIKTGLDAKITKGSDVIIIACGIPRKKGQTRLDIAQSNVDTMKKVIPPLAKLSKDGVFLVITNPVDIITYAVWKYSCFAKNRVFGTGTSLDTYRLRHFLTKRLGINPYNINADIMGEHGECSVPLWSMAHIAGSRLREVDEDIGHGKEHSRVITSGDKLLEWKEGTNWSIGKIAAKITEDILRNSNKVHYVSVMAKGLLGIKSDCFMSFPAVIGNRGVYSVINQHYDDAENEMIKDAISDIDEAKKTLKF